MGTPSGNGKRRRGAQHSPSSPAKRLKSQTLPLSTLHRLGDELLSSRAHLNNLPILLSHMTPSADVGIAVEVLLSLQSFFVPLLSEIPGKGEVARDDDPESVFRVWLHGRFDEFVTALVDIAVSVVSDVSIRDAVVDAIMDLAKLGKGGRFQSGVYHKFLYSAVHASHPVEPVLQLLKSKYFEYADVCYFTYSSLDKIAREFNSRNVPGTKSLPILSDDIVIHNIYEVLSQMGPLEGKGVKLSMWSESGLSSKSGRDNLKDSSSEHAFKRLRLKFTKAWLSYLKLPLPLDVYKEVLASIRQIVIPSMLNPVILCDFLTRSYDVGGVISVMALSGLFILMTRHGLEYPKFYEKLYSLLTPSVFMAKHRAVFFQLLDTCLKSSYLPAYLAAAFTKKLSRLALSVPPSGALIIIALVHNLLRRHPSINFLVNRIMHEEADANNPEDNEDTDDNNPEDNEDAVISETACSEPTGQTEKKCIDPFNCAERDLAKSNAMGSSLWEIETLRRHYSPAVSRFVASLENDLTVRAKTAEMRMEDFSSASYATVFGDEIRRRIKQVPLAFYATKPSSLFKQSDFPGWQFGEQTREDKAAVSEKVVSSNVDDSPSVESTDNL